MPASYMYIHTKAPHPTHRNPFPSRKETFTTTSTDLYQLTHLIPLSPNTLSNIHPTYKIPLGQTSPARRTTRTLHPLTLPVATLVEKENKRKEKKFKYPSSPHRCSCRFPRKNRNSSPLLPCIINKQKKAQAILSGVGMLRPLPLFANNARGGWYDHHDPPEGS